MLGHLDLQQVPGGEHRGNLVDQFGFAQVLDADRLRVPVDVVDDVPLLSGLEHPVLEVLEPRPVLPYRILNLLPGEERLAELVQCLELRDRRQRFRNVAGEAHLQDGVAEPQTAALLDRQAPVRLRPGDPGADALCGVEAVVLRRAECEGLRAGRSRGDQPHSGPVRVTPRVDAEHRPPDLCRRGKRRQVEADRAFIGSQGAADFAAIRVAERPREETLRGIRRAAEQERSAENGQYRDSISHESLLLGPAYQWVQRFLQEETEYVPPPFRAPRSCGPR